MAPMIFRLTFLLAGHRIVRALVALTAMSAIEAHAEAGAASAAGGCKLATVGTGMVSAVVDGRTLMLDDGREVRLLGIEAAPLSHALGVEAKLALEAAVVGRFHRHHLEAQRA